MKMKAAVLVAPERVEVDEFDVPEPMAGQVLVRMRAASICGSDLHVVFDGFHRGRIGLPGYPGHEGVGEIVESRADGVASGQLVLTVPPTPTWNRCFGQYQVLEPRFLVPLPDGGDASRLLLAQQLGTTIYALRKFWRTSGEGGATQGCVTVIGAGSAGLFFVQQLKAMGVEKIVVADLELDRLDMARELGADVVVHAPAESVVEATLDVTGGAGAELVIEAAGYDDCRAQCVDAVRPRGRIGFFGYPQRQGMAPFPIDAAFRKAPSVEFFSGTQYEPGLRSFHDAVRAIHAGEIEVGYCLEPRFPLDQADEAFATAHERRGGAIKVGVDVAAD